VNQVGKLNDSMDSGHLVVRMKPSTVLCLALGATVTLVSPAAGAQDSPATAPSSSDLQTQTNSPEAPTSLSVEVTPGPLSLDTEVVKSAIARELGVELAGNDEIGSVGQISVLGLPGPSALVRYRSPDGATAIERRVTLPVDAEHQATVIAWVAGNLARNEAADILAQWRTNSAKSAASATSTPGAPNAQAAASPKAPPAASKHDSPEKQEPAKPPPAKPKPPSGTMPLENLNLSGWYPHLGLYRDAEQRRFRLHLGAAYSRVGGVEGLGLDLGVHRDDGLVRGATFSGLWTEGEGKVYGARLSGIFAIERGPLYGVELTGITSLNHAAVTGVQGSSIFGQVKGHVAGAQLAGVAVLANEDLEGVQAAGAVSLLMGSVRGAQLSGIYNQAADARGLQATGVYNRARDVTGLQLALVNQGRNVQGSQVGLVNVSQEIDGFSLGVVNVTEHLDGYALGLVNVAPNLRVQALSYYESPGYLNAGVRYVFGHLTSSVAGGVNPDRDLARARFGVGGRLELSPLVLDAEGGYGWILERVSHTPADRAHAVEARATATIELVPKTLGVFAGAGAELPVSGTVPVRLHGHWLAGLSLF